MGRKLALVVGAGVGGCQAARALLRAGYDVLVLEQGPGVGGVWRRYAGTDGVGDIDFLGFADVRRCRARGWERSNC